MLFQTFDFLLFIVPVLLAFWALSGRPLARVLLLIAASYFFYMAGPKTDPLPTPWYYVSLLAFSTFLDFACGKLIYAQEAGLQSGDPARVRKAVRTRNTYLVASLVGNLSLLGYFKYTGFLLAAFSDIASAAGLDVVVPHLKLALPIGISFYTFQSLSYTIDIWRRRLTPEPSIARFSLFVVFFPQLVAGPIVRASEFLPQLRRGPRFSIQGMEEGMFRILKGLAKKIVLGDWIAAQFTDHVFANPGTYTSPELLLGLYAFTLQLYADFSAYTDMAIGVARLLGFTLPENFDRPYQSRNLGEFWRRWHMTLSTWLRDYLFFPLGGSRGSAARTYFNLWLTMFLVGMWHGASWNFVIYASLHAFAMVFNRFNRLRGRRSGLMPVVAWLLGGAALFGVMTLVGGGVLHLPETSALIFAGFVAAVFLLVSWLPETGGRLNTAVHVGLTFHFTVLSRIFFRADDLEISRAMVGGLLKFDGHFLRDGLLSPYVWAALVLGLAYHFTPRRWVDQDLLGIFRRLPGPVIGVVFALLGLALMHIMDGAPRAFIYFQF